MTQHAVALKFHKTCRADVTYSSTSYSHITCQPMPTQHATVVTQPLSVHRAYTTTQHATVLIQLHNTQSWWQNHKTRHRGNTTTKHTNRRAAVIHFLNLNPVVYSVSKVWWWGGGTLSIKKTVKTLTNSSQGVGKGGGESPSTSLICFQYQLYRS